MNKNNVKKMLELLIEIEQLQALFYRNVFDLNEEKIDRNEMKYLYFLSDSLHNLPEFIKTCQLFLDDKDVDMRCWHFYAVELYKVKAVISETYFICVANKIKINNRIKRWMMELERMGRYVDLLIDILKKEGLES